MSGETPVANAMKAVLEAEFQPEFLAIRNDSGRHKGHAGDDGSGESHFHITIISGAFETLNNLARHRMIYAALDRFIKNEVHALSIKALAPSEKSSTATLE